MSSEPDPNGASGRDSFGRFAAGNKLGKGNPRLRALADAQNAIRAAFGPLDVVAVLTSLHEQALNGDVAAATTFLTRVCGKPREEPSELCIDIPPVTDAATLAAALSGIVGATTAGALDLADSERLASLVGRVGEALALRQIEERIAALEARR